MKVNVASPLAVLATLALFMCTIWADSDQELYDVAANAFNNEEYELAIGDYQKILKKGSDAKIKAKAAFFLAESYFRLKDYQKAKDAFKTYLMDYPSHSRRPEGQFRISESFYFLEDYAKAGAAYSRYVKDNPKHDFVPLALYSASGSFTETGDYEKAREGYERIIRDFPKNEMAENSAYNLGWVHFRAGEFNKSADAFIGFSKKYPESDHLAQALLRAADAKFKADEFDASLSLYNQVLAKGKGAFRNDSHQGIAWSYYKKNEFDKAANAFMVLGRSFENLNKKAESFYQAIQAYYSSEKFKEGVAAADELIKTCPKSSLVGDALYWRGLFFRKLGQLDEAAKSLNQAMSKKDTKVSVGEIKMELGNVYYNLEDYKTAVKVLQDAAGKEKNIKVLNQIKFDLSRAFHELGETKKALDLAGTIGGAGSDEKLLVLTKFSMGEFQFSQENYKAALSYYQHVLSKTKDAKLIMDSRYRMGWSFKLLEKPQLAIDVLIKMDKENPKNDYAREVRFLIGGLYNDLGKEAEARKMFTKLLQDKGEYTADSYLALADMDFRAEKFKPVIAVLKDFLSKYAQHELSIEAHYLMAEAAFQDGQKDLALNHYSKVVGGKEKDLRESSLYGRAWIYYEKNQPNKALGDLDSLLREFPQSSYKASVVQLKSKILLARKDHGKARAALEKALSELKGGDDGESILLNLATVETEAKNYDKALSLYDRFLRDYPKSKKKGRVLYEKGWLLMQIKKPTEASAVFKSYKSSYPQGELISDVEFALGELSYDNAKFKEALAFYSACQKDDRYKDKSLYKSAWSHFKLNQFDQAAAFFARLVKECGESHLFVESLYREGLSYLKGAKFKEADVALANFLSKGRNSTLYSEALFNLAKVKEKLSLQEEAKDKYEQYIKQFAKGESRSNAEFRLGNIFLQKKEYVRARSHFQVVLKDKTHYLSLESQYGVGETYFHNKEYEDAIRSYLKTLLYKDGDKWQAASLFRIAQSHKLLQRNAKAAKYFKKLLDTYPASEQAKSAADELQRLEG